MSRPQRAFRLATREFRSFLTSPVGWTIVAVFFLLAGVILVGLLFGYRQDALKLAQSPQVRAGDMGLHVSDWVVRPYLNYVGSLLLVFIPLLTMRSIAEERRARSLELLFSFPLRGQDLIAGKFLGSLFSLATLLCVLPIHGVVLGAISRPDWGAALVGVLGLFLLGTFVVSLGILISSLSQTQIEAAVLTLGVLLLLGLGPGVAQAGSPGLARVIGFVAVLDRFEVFTRGVISLEHVAFFCGGTILWLALALRSLDLLRWRGT